MRVPVFNISLTERFRNFQSEEIECKYLSQQHSVSWGSCEVNHMNGEANKNKSLVKRAVLFFSFEPHLHTYQRGNNCGSDRCNTREDSYTIACWNFLDMYAITGFYHCIRVSCNKNHQMKGTIFKLPVLQFLFFTLLFWEIKHKSTKIS